jgi:hypothetical protein
VAQSGTRLGDRAARSCWSRACFLLDYTYLTCPNRASGALRYRHGLRSMRAPETRRLPLYLDSATYRESVRTAPTWSSYPPYCQAIDLVKPDGAMARDVLNNPAASLEGYRRMCRDGYQQVVIPVWQVLPAWDPWFRCDHQRLYGRARSTLRSYVERSPTVAIGGLVHGPCLPPPGSCRQEEAAGGK